MHFKCTFQASLSLVFPNLSFYLKINTCFEEKRKQQANKANIFQYLEKEWHKERERYTQTDTSKDKGIDTNRQTHHINLCVSQVYSFISYNLNSLQQPALLFRNRLFH